MRLITAAILALATSMPAQPPATDPAPEPSPTANAWKLQSYLADQLRQTAPDAQVAVYFVMRDRLGYHHWFPRLNGVPVDARRAIVMAELRQHAERTQARTVNLLRDAALRGDAKDLHCNWLGNFVQVKATPAVIDSVLALDDVWEAWADCLGPGHVCEDAMPAPTGSWGPPGNGPVEVGADKVWALGFDGSGVIVMNADSGLNRAHQAIELQVWRNVPEGWLPNGIDEDNNGYVDDIFGYDFGSMTGSIEDYGGHGTQTAGVMVADDACNNTTYGIAPGGRVMTGKLSLESSQWNAIQYALQMGAHTQTSSHSYKNTFLPPPNYAMHRDVAENSLAAGLIRTNSTSNNGADCNNPLQVVQRPFNVSAPGNVPAPYLDPNQTLVGRKGGVIGVGSYDLTTGNLSLSSPCGPSAWFLNDLLYVLPAYPLANWDPQDDDYPWQGFMATGQLGLLKPDVVAPTGTDTPFGPFSSCSVGPFGGTSNATPVVMGCIMLWKSANMSLTPEDVGMIVHQTSRDQGFVAGKENTWGAGKIDALAGLHRALAVHRVNGEPAWDVQQRRRTPMTLEVDGSPDRPAVIALGFSRTEVSFGFVTSGIGANIVPLLAGTTGPNGDALRATFTAPGLRTPVTLYTQAFVDDTGGPTGQWLASNVVGIDFVP